MVERIAFHRRCFQLSKVCPRILVKRCAIEPPMLVPGQLPPHTCPDSIPVLMPVHERTNGLFLLLIEAKVPVRDAGAAAKGLMRKQDDRPVASLTKTGCQGGYGHGTWYAHLP